jgi:hypothetical protein
VKLTEIPYISHVPRDGRSLMLQPWYDASSKSWYLCVEKKPGDFIRMRPAAMASGLYYAVQPASSLDLEMPLATLVAQHLSFPPVANAMYRLIDDVHLLAASLEKIELLQRVATGGTVSEFLVESEVEYQFILARGMYDLLQAIAKEVGRLLLTPEGSVAELPDSFASIALDGDRPCIVQELVAKYRLPIPLAYFYFSHSERFLKVRAIRVAIEHHGKRLPQIFVMKRGFGISTKGSPSWSSLEVWDQHELLPNRIGSVRALATFLAESMLDTLAAFEAALRSTIAPQLLPKAVSEGNRIFVTNPSIGRLTNLATASASPWTEVKDPVDSVDSVRP